MKVVIQLCLCILSFVVCASAQLYPDSKGRDFWLTFPPNFHNGEGTLSNDSVQQLEHKLYLYVGAEVPTTGTITITTIDGLSRTVSFTITDPSILFEYSMYFDGVELVGSNRGGVVDVGSSQAERPVPQSIHIQSASDVTLYAMNQAPTTSDALLVLPTDALTGDYVVMAYSSDIQTPSPNNNNSTPSQFAIVATEDATRIEITPTVATTFSAAGVPIIATLQRGESFLVQASLSGPQGADLTGSKVRASKPVGVFGGHQRTTLPVAFVGQLNSRDYLIEQMSPVGTWGKSAFVTPFARSSNEQDVGTDLYRVVAAFDSTAVLVDGVFQVLMNVGQIFESALTQAAAITTSRPALTAQFKKTSGTPSGGSNQRVGDPLMMLVPPAEQFMSEYRFINVQSYEYNGSINTPSPIYGEQYLNIVIPTSGIGGLTLDGLPVSPGRFQQLAQTPYSWTQIVMSDGVHHVKGDTTFGIYVYGYGVANSYGYIGGMAFRPLDTYPPIILGDARCGTVIGTVADSLLGDSRVNTITVVPGSEQNVALVLGAFLPPQAVVRFQASLVNSFDDGSIAVDATDVVGQTFRRTIDVPGFTVGVATRGADPLPGNRGMILPVGKSRCDSVQIENYGKYPHQVTKLYFTSGAQVDAPVLPILLAPGELRWVRYCRSFDVEGITYDTLVIADSCFERPVLAVALDAQLDKQVPTVQSSIDPCSTTVTLIISDILEVDFGLESARIIDSVVVNCLITPPADVPVPIVAHTAQWTVTVIDPFEDAIYGYEAIDSAGNVSTSVDTIPGFTLEIAGAKGAFRVKTMQSYQVGLLGCEPIELRNYGSFGVSIPSIMIRGNVLFSAPQHQFPMFLASGESKTIEVCFSPLTTDTTDRIDTIEFEFGCNRSGLEVRSEGVSLAYEGVSRCNVPVGTDIMRIASSGLLAAPLPAHSVLTLVFATPIDGGIIRFLDLTGAEVYRTQWHGSATQALAVDVQALSDGTYVCIVEAGGRLASTTCMIRR
ncbi:MAG: IgGFc-binding protein [bacterium]|nr:IgGFc-binding protein [bacterium]